MNSPLFLAFKLQKVTLPDSTTVASEFNLQGETKKLTDQNGTVHEFTFDKLGRVTDDKATVQPGSDVDDTIDKLGTTFDVRGRVDKLTSYKKSDGSVLNQIVNEYNGLDMLTKQYQEHIGEKDGSTLYVGFNYVTTASGGKYTKGMRPTSVRYPAGELMRLDYGTANGNDDKLSRVASIKDNSNTVLAAYTYLGLGQVVIEDYQQPDVKLDYTNDGTSSSSSSSSAIDKYPGFDRFGRITQQLWRYYGATPSDVDKFTYGYDRNSNPGYPGLFM